MFGAIQMISYPPLFFGGGDIKYNFTQGALCLGREEMSIIGHKSFTN